MKEKRCRCHAQSIGPFVSHEASHLTRATNCLGWAQRGMKLAIRGAIANKRVQPAPPALSITMNVIGIQLDIAWENKTENYVRAARLISAANPAPGSLVVLPEMFATGFSMDAVKSQENLPSPTLEFLSKLARESQIGILAGLVLRDADGRPRNESVFVSPAGDVQCRYAKIQTFSLAEETQHFTAGHEIQVFSFGGFRIAPFVWSRTSRAPPRGSSRTRRRPRPRSPPPAASSR